MDKGRKPRARQSSHIREAAHSRLFKSYVNVCRALMPSAEIGPAVEQCAACTARLATARKSKSAISNADFQIRGNAGKNVETGKATTGAISERHRLGSKRAAHYKAACTKTVREQSGVCASPSSTTMREGRAA